MPAPSPDPPQVIVDVLHDDGLLFVAVSSLADHPLTRVVTRFDRAVVDAAGRELGRLALFRGIAFLAPRRSIRTFVDSVEGYFRRRQPRVFTLELSWRDGGGKRRQANITHDLGIYRDLLLARPAGGPPS